MRVDAFDFDLPAEAIALHPARPRDAARLLVVQPGSVGAAAGLADRHVRDLPGLLRPGDVLVVNDTRVIPARLTGTRFRAGVEARVEVTLHRRETPSDWLAFARPARKLAPGDRVAFTAAGARDDVLLAEVVGREGGEAMLRFEASGPALDERLRQVGATPLPPYIASRRTIAPEDTADYQTMFARDSGAVAAPTAGLHFTPALRDALAAHDIGLCTVTLHVGAGTFLPVKAEDTESHVMHAEWGRVEAAAATALNRARAQGGRIVAVGTTSLRLLESAADANGAIAPFEGLTDIFIRPGTRIRAVDLLMTNFHLPRSTLFMLVSAFAGLPVMQAAYAHAIRSGYRFYSYGDACLLHRAAPA